MSTVSVTNLKHESASGNNITLDSSGNVGVGTNSPASYDWANNINLVLANTSGSAGLSIVSSTGGNGEIAFADGTSGSDRYRGYIYYDHSIDAMVFWTAAGERMRIDSSGRVTMPYQPSAALGLNSGFSSASSVITWDVVHHNVGSHYNSSTGVFTCPVSGMYLVSIMVMTNNTDVTLDIELRRNGSTSNQFVPYQAATGGLYNQVSGMTIISCSANDTLALRLNSGNIYGSGGRHSAANFRLIG